MPSSQLRIIEPRPVIVPAQLAAVEAEGLQLLTVVLKLVARGVVEREGADLLAEGREPCSKNVWAKVVISLLSFCLDTKRNEKIKKI